MRTILTQPIRIRWHGAMMTCLAVSLLGLAGCAQWARVFGAQQPRVTVTPPTKPAKPAPKPVDTTPAPPLKTIVVEQLQQGHYAKGRAQLQRFIQQHPDDRAARDMWRQLTENPDKLLGSRSRIHVVKPGESYSMLAARYAGGASRFLALARYNGADNPSVLAVGQRIRVPIGLKRASSDEPTADKAEAGSDEARVATPASASSTDKAEQLQLQSLALMQKGEQAQALDRMGQALDIDPRLKSSGDEADKLRKQLLANYHQRAVVLYRDQKLTQAISLWDKILAIDPNYTAAIIYRTQARELQKRLKKL